MQLRVIVLATLVLLLEGFVMLEVHAAVMSSIPPLVTDMAMSAIYRLRQ